MKRPLAFLFLTLFLFSSSVIAQNFWQSVSLSSGGSVISFAIGSTGTIFAETFGSGVFRSTDNGASWTQVNTGLTDLYVYGLAFNSSGQIFSGTDTKGIFRSTDNGGSWTQVGATSSNIRSFAVNSTGTVLAGTLSDGVFRSTNNGTSWSQVNTGLTNTGVISLAAMSPSGEVAALQRSSGWRQLASAPSAREEHAAAWNPQDVQMLVFGGVNGSGTFLNDLWTYRPAGNAWTEVKPTGGPPTARFRPSAVWDLVNSQLLVFGGAGVNGTLNDLWAYRPSTGTWAQMAAGPSPRLAQTAVWDATNAQMLVFGGWSGSAALNDLWSYQPAANRWTRLDAAGPPLERGWHAAVWDPDNSQMLVFGGSNNVSLMNDLWAYRPGDNTWRQLSPASNPPSMRDWATAVWDSGNAQVLVFGGAPFGPVPGAQVAANDLFSYRPSGNTWSPLPGAGPPPPRFAHTAVWDPSGGEMLIFGGLSSLNGPSLGDLWGYRPTAATSVGEDHSSIPTTLYLSQNFPNPFNPSTTIRFSLPKSSYVVLKVFNLLGEEVATLVNEQKSPGTYSITWDATGFPSGLYFYRLQAGNFVETKKLILIK